MLNLLERINSKILLKITLLVIIEIILIVGSFGVLTYFQSQQSSLGNSINIAGKNRYLTANLLLQTEKYLDGSSDGLQIKAAMDSLQSNIITLKQGGMISGVDLRPLHSDFLDMWKIIDQNWNAYKTYVTQNVLSIPPNQEGKVMTTSSSTTTITTKVKAIGQFYLEAGLESMASNLVKSSDKLVTQLGQQTDKNSQNLLLLQILFATLIVSILVLILFLVARMLRPVFVLTQATSNVEKGNLDVSVEQKGNDELSVLSRTFNSMVSSLRDYIKKQGDLTKQLEAANEELKRKDRLKDDFINIAAHELCGPIQPILGLAEILRSRKRKGGDSSNSNIGKQDDAKLLDIIIRNAKRLLLLEQSILDMAKIESQSLKLERERFDLVEKIHDVINDFWNEFSKEKMEFVFIQSQEEPIFVNADKVRIFEVISNLLSNAVKFTNTDGSITINAERKDAQALVSIRDTGSGIGPEIMPELFSKFVTNSPRGTGVGLFISKNIIEAHGGKIWAENNPDGKGATFTFSLPIS